MATQSQASGFVDTAQNHLKEGATMGAAAFVLNYVVMYLFAIIDGVEGTAEVATWKMVGWLFYGAHMVDLEISALGQSQTVGVFDNASGTEGLTSTIPEMVYYLVPVVVLLGAGYMLYQRTNARLDTEAAAGLGATVAAGYIVLAAVGTFLFEYSASGATIGPKLTTAIALAGLAYPLVLGAVGAVAASET